ncbi:MAG TPA: HlyD family efflux transporter periplasmic adaptor subunit [Clostridia bacterium]|nr:HlyD family efflux transporter periplasmic adaptor subunit [Clostridia bacterium]
MRYKLAKDKTDESAERPEGRKRAANVAADEISARYSQKSENDTDEKAAEQSKSRNAKRATLGGLLLILFVLLYIPSLMNWLSGRHVANDVIRNGIIEEYIQSNAVIIRDEKLLPPSSIEGRYIAEIGEGERTPAFSRIALVMNATSDKLLKDIDDINSKIVKAKMEKAEKTDFFSDDLAKLDIEIGAEVQDLIAACNSRSFTDMAKYRNEIGKIVEKKAGIVGANSTDTYITSLQKQKDDIQARINRNTVEIKSETSGVVSYTIDGFEKQLTPAVLKKLTPKELDGISEKYAGVIGGYGTIKAGMPAAKIIKGTDLYLAAAVPAKQAAAFKEGGSIHLRLGGADMETTGTVNNINTGGDGRKVIVVRINRGVDTLSSQRIVSVDFISKIEEGLKVPLKCLRDFSADGSKARIMLIKYNVAASRTVDVLCRDDEYAIISTPEGEVKKTVNLYDTYILNPDNIAEGDIIE